MKNDNVPIPYLRECIALSNDGILRWRARPPEHFATTLAWTIWNSRFAGTKAGRIAGRERGHVQIQITVKNRIYRIYAHRIVWALSKGAWPSDEIDHIDGDPFNNKIDNLREVDHSHQMHNMKHHKNNTSGYMGVVWHNKGALWQARITVKRKVLSLGYYHTPEEAHQAYLAAKKVHH